MEGFRNKVVQLSLAKCTTYKQTLLWAIPDLLFSLFSSFLDSLFNTVDIK